MSFDVQNLFEQVQQQNETAASSGKSFTVNEYLLKPKVNTSYTFRLLWLPPVNGSARKRPFINQYIHHYWDENTVSGSKDHVVYCLTSEYIKGDTPEGYACPVCKACSELFKKSSEGSESAGEMYKTFKRSMRGYIPVYVVSGPEEDIGKVKILQYTKSAMEEFNLKIFGKPPKPKRGEEPMQIDKSDVLGPNAFLYEDDNGIRTRGRNFKLSVTSKKMMLNGRSVDMPQYRFDFAANESEITKFGDTDIVPGYLEKLSKDIRFDEDFYKESTIDELNEFKLRYMDVEDAISQKHIEKPEDTSFNPYEKKQVQKEEAAKEPVKNPVEPVNESPAVSSDDDIDINSLLEGI